LALVGYCQARLIRKSIDLARSEFLSTHRPKIRVKHVWLLNEVAYDKPIGIRVVCVNCGTTDAVMVDYGIAVMVVKKGGSLPPDPTFPSFKIILRLESGISLPFPDFTHRITEDEEIGLQGGGADLYCFGYVHYRDDVKRLRTTAFCRMLKFTNRLGPQDTLVLPIPRNPITNTKIEDCHAAEY
jgi:hypothetical protein